MKRNLSLVQAQIPGALHPHERYEPPTQPNGGVLRPTPSVSSSVKARLGRPRNPNSLPIPGALHSTGDYKQPHYAGPFPYLRRHHPVTRLG